MAAMAASPANSVARNPVIVSSLAIVSLPFE
jgi:hypothetical protein